MSNPYIEQKKAYNYINSRFEVDANLLSLGEKEHVLVDEYIIACTSLFEVSAASVKKHVERLVRTNGLKVSEGVITFVRE